MVAQIRQLTIGMTRDTPFSYNCGRCSRCCYHKGITLNPYEVLRLARHQGMTTTEFTQHYTESGGTRLRQRDDGGCIFLTAQGCGAHADRPLVCRIYPLGRHISPDDEETFSELDPHPQTDGSYGVSGVVGDYLVNQGAVPYMQAADRYLNLFREMADVLYKQADRLTPVEREMIGQQCEYPKEANAPGQAWLDIDHAVDQYCSECGLVKPAEAQLLMELHLEALSTWSGNLKEREIS